METYNPSDADLRKANHQTFKKVLVRQLQQQYGMLLSEAAEEAERLLRKGIKSLF